MNPPATLSGRGLSSNLIKNPYFVTGFAEVKPCFSIEIAKSSEVKLGWLVKLKFFLNFNDQSLLELIKAYFGGVITESRLNKFIYSVEYLSELVPYALRLEPVPLEIIINHFDKYSFISPELAWNFFLFKRAYEIVKGRKHLTVEDLKEVLSLKVSMDKDVSLHEELNSYLTDDIIPAPKVEVDQNIKDPNWISGFVSRAGCFIIDIRYLSTDKKILKQITLKLQIPLSIKDNKFICSLSSYLGSGSFYSRAGRNTGDFRVLHPRHLGAIQQRKFSSEAPHNNFNLFKNKSNGEENTGALLTQTSKLNPWWVTGFVDGEGSFSLSISKSHRATLGWTVSLCFIINLHVRDLELVNSIKNFFSVGSVSISGEIACFRVNSREGLEVIISHFNNYPLLTHKRVDYELWKEAFSTMQNKDHLIIEGLRKIIALKASLYRGLSDELKVAFPNIIPVVRPLIIELAETSKSINSYWVGGFASGEGSFGIYIYKSKTKLGEAVKIIFLISQHARDELLMRSLIEYFGCGNVIRKSR
jgi:hypothetical protein